VIHCPRVLLEALMPFGMVHGRARSRAILRHLASVEVPEVMNHLSDFPIVLRGAASARVKDADGNRYIDLTSFFGVALVGHRNDAVVRAVRVALGRLVHAMGDVHPGAAKLPLLQRLSELMPAPGYRGFLGLSGADAVETALKFACAATSRGRFLAFEGAYHGVFGHALEVTHNPLFRTPFQAMLKGLAAFAPWPKGDGSDLDMCLTKAQDLARAGPVAAIIVEPIQGRGGIRVPPPGFLGGLAAIAKDVGAALVVDEIYCGMFRTGRFLASEEEILAPDAVCLGKALGGGLPISVCMLSPRLAEAVLGAEAEAPHTSTFLGHPLGCAAGLAVLNEVRRKGLGEAAVRIGQRVMEVANGWRERSAVVRDVRGRGAMVGVEVADPKIASRVVALALKDGVIILTEGPMGNVLAFTPPLTISDGDLDRALGVVERHLLKEGG